MVFANFIESRQMSLKKKQNQRLFQHLGSLKEIGLLKINVEV
jgi:hypothetical protein